jgi:antitoxin component YwqK of YwqJK toxin-antitoxin module
MSCGQRDDPKIDTDTESPSEVVKMRRDDGTVSSVNQVDELGKVHGVRVTFYGDGKTIYSKHSFVHGRKQGPAMWYYKGGQLFKHTHFEDGKRQGLTRIYYKNGNLLAEFESEKGNVLPGLKEYKEDGSLVSNYPEIHFEEENYLASRNRVDLVVNCSKRRSGVKFFVLQRDNGKLSRVYLITENDRATMQFYVNPGESLDKRIEILAEIPTELGNVLARTYTYHLQISN